MTPEQAIGTLATHLSLSGSNGSDIQEVINKFATDTQKELVERSNKSVSTQDNFDPAAYSPGG